MAATPPAEQPCAASPVTVVGGGLMGHGIAIVFARAGHPVTIQEPVAEVRDSLPARIEASLISIDADPSLAATVRVEADLAEAVASASWVFEAAPEDLELKQQLFARLGELAAPEAVIASNSSVFRVGDVTAHASGRERMLGAHWWNPPFLVPLVEVVQGEHSSPAAVAGMLSLLESAGKSPVHVRRDVAGFIGNRLQHALWREAFELIDAGVCDAATIDTVVKNGMGRRFGVLGPVENADLVGLDLTLAIHDYLLPQLSRATEPSRGLRERVARGELGMKSRRGWREWTPEEADAARGRLLAALREAR